MLVGDASVVSGGDDQVLAAISAIGTGPAHVGDESEPGVVDGARATTRRDLDDRGAISFQVEDPRHVHGVGVTGQEQRGRVEQAVEDADLVAGRDSDLLHPDPHRLQRRRRYTVEERLDTAHEVEVVAQELRGRLGGEAVGELECAEAGLDPIRCQDFGRDGCVVTTGLHDVAHLGMLSSSSWSLGWIRRVRDHNDTRHPTTSRPQTLGRVTYPLAHTCAAHAGFRRLLRRTRHQTARPRIGLVRTGR
jgi:hypothetical protein